MLKISEVKDPADIRRVSALANKTWNAHYVDIIGQQQIDYMLSKFQSESAISRQIAHGTIYFIVKKESQSVAYYSLKLCHTSKNTQLSKLYVINEQQRKGIGRDIISFIELYCIDHDIHKIWLTVNRNNNSAINFYHSVDFKIIDSCVTDIGSKFVMDDYIMQKLIN